MMPFVFLKGFQFSPGPRSKVWGATQLVLHNSAHFHQVVVANLAMYALLNFRSLKLKTCSIFQNGHHPNESSHSYPSVLLWAKVCFLRTYLYKIKSSQNLHKRPFVQLRTDGAVFTNFGMTWFFSSASFKKRTLVDLCYVCISILIVNDLSMNYSINDCWNSIKHIQLLAW